MEKVKRVIIFIISCLIFYRTFLASIDSTFQLLIYTLVPVVYIIWNLRYIKNNIFSTKKTREILILFVISVLFPLFGSLLSSLINGVYDTSYIVRWLGIVTYILGYLFLFLVIHKHLKPVI